MTNRPVTVLDEFQLGRLHEQVREHDRRLDAVNGSIDRAEAAISGLRVDLGRISTKVGIYAAVAAFVAGIAGSAVAAAVVYAITKGSAS